MLTVYKYGFSEPVIEVPKPQGMGIGTLLLIAGAAYWAWKEGWLKKLAGKMGQASKGGPQQ